jgi:hypothetical protein
MSALNNGYSDLDNILVLCYNMVNNAREVCIKWQLQAGFPCLLESKYTTFQRQLTKQTYTTTNIRAFALKR